MSHPRLAGELLKSAAALHVTAFMPYAFAASEARSDGGFGAFSLLSWLISTLAVMLIIFALAYLLRRSRYFTGRSGNLRLISHLALGPKERVVELEAGGRRLLLGVTPAQINLLCELDTGDLKAPEDNGSGHKASLRRGAAASREEGQEGAAGGGDLSASQEFARRFSQVPGRDGESPARA